MRYLFEPVYHKFSRSKFQVYERWRSPRYLSELASIVPILTQWYPPVKLQRGRAWLSGIIWTPTTKRCTDTYQFMFMYHYMIKQTVAPIFPGLSALITCYYTDRVIISSHCTYMYKYCTFLTSNYLLLWLFI